MKLLYLSVSLTIILWLFTLYRVATSSYQGRYTKRRWLLSVGCWGIIGLLLYWMNEEREREMLESETMEKEIFSTVQAIATPTE